MRRSFLIAMIHNDRNALVLDTVQRGIVEEAVKHGYEMIVHPVAASSPDATRDIVNFVRRSRVDGLIILPPVSGIKGLADMLDKEGVPAVAVSSVPIDGYIDVILSRERAAAADVARFLLSLGHRQIAIINGPRTMTSAIERRGGFIDALNEAGASLVGEFEGDYSFDSGLKAARQLLALSPRPTAVFAANDNMAAAVLKVTSALGIHVPADLSVVGFDGSVLADMLTPALTTVVRPFGDMARQATTSLINHIEGRPSVKTVDIPLSIIISESAGRAP